MTENLGDFSLKRGGKDSAHPSEVYIVWWTESDRDTSPPVLTAVLSSAAGFTISIYNSYRVALAITVDVFDKVKDGICGMCKYSASVITPKASDIDSYANNL